MLWSFLAGGASSLLAVGAGLAVLFAIRDHRAPDRHLPPSFQLPTVAGTKARIIVPTARQLRRWKRERLASTARRAS